MPARSHSHLVLDNYSLKCYCFKPWRGEWIRHTSVYSYPCGVHFAYTVFCNVCRISSRPEEKTNTNFQEGEFDAHTHPNGADSRWQLWEYQMEYTKWIYEWNRYQCPRKPDVHSSCGRTSSGVRIASVSAETISPSRSLWGLKQRSMVISHQFRTLMIISRTFSYNSSFLAWTAVQQ